MSFLNVFSGKKTPKQKVVFSPSEKLASKPIEKRKEVRHDSYLSTLINVDGKDIFATIVNFSETGFGILAGKPFDSDKPIELSLSLKDAEPVKVVLDVKSCREVDCEYMIGAKVIKFCEHQADLFKTLSQYRTA